MYYRYRFHELYQEYCRQNLELQRIRNKRRADSLHDSSPAISHLNQDRLISRNMLNPAYQNQFDGKNDNPSNISLPDSYQVYDYQTTTKPEDLHQHSRSLKRQKNKDYQQDSTQQKDQDELITLDEHNQTIGSFAVDNSLKYQQSLTELLRTQFNDSPKNNLDHFPKSPSPSFKPESAKECAMEKYVKSFFNETS